MFSVIIKFELFKTFTATSLTTTCQKRRLRTACSQFGEENCQLLFETNSQQNLRQCFNNLLWVVNKL